MMLRGFTVRVFGAFRAGQRRISDAIRVSAREINPRIETRIREVQALKIFLFKMISSFLRWPI